MEELGEFDESYEESQKKIAEKQATFEESQREYEKNSESIDIAEKKKMNILNWAIIGLMFVFILFLAWKLLL